MTLTLTSPSPATAAAIAKIEREFGAAGECRRFKARVRGVLMSGTGHPAVRARYRARAQMLSGSTLPQAIRRVDGWLHDEQTAFGIAAAAWGARPRLSLMVLGELRLILRWMRAAGWSHRFPAVRYEAGQP